MVVAYERVFETVFDWETKQLFKKWFLTGGGRLREVVAIENWLYMYSTTFVLKEWIKQWYYQDKKDHDLRFDVTDGAEKTFKSKIFI